jgi:hypothetical protein
MHMFLEDSKTFILNRKMITSKWNHLSMKFKVKIIKGGLD